MVPRIPNWCEFRRIRFVLPSIVGRSGAARIRLPGLVIALSCQFATGCQHEPKVGFIGTLSGTSSEIGGAGRDGMQFYFEGVGKEFVACDDRGIAEGGIECLRRFDSLGVRLVVGPMLSSVATAIVPEAGRRGMLLISPTASTGLLSGRNDMLVRLIPDNLREVDALAARLLESRVGSAAIFFDLANEAYSRPMAERFDSLLRSSGRRVLMVRSYRSSVDLDFTPWLAQIPDTSAIFVAITGRDLGILVADQKRLGSRQSIYATHWSLGEDFRIAAGESADHVVFGAFREQIAKNSRLDSLRSGFEHRFGFEPSYGAVLGWESAWLAMQAGHSRDASVLRSRVIAASRLGPLGWPIDLDPNGDSRGPVLLCRMKAGRCEELRP